ncbi:DUF6265 family protein [Flavobacteriaceae bacterium S356]|uniref:DUF6265 family protein n=1 Tax=Asprobacillus argus TaxID=3076534 RepID=A0ABU3LF04_9FLAO|nr:DUF6265 family protein [Flavobacteriaceae bacterium S356]
MKIIKFGVALSVAILLLSFCNTSQTQKVDFLVGTWKIEGKETYEAWAIENDKLVGESFKKRGEQKYVTETLEIKKEGGKWVYIATVKNQNNGQGIPFTLQEVKDDLYSFENPAHDFPKKIQYKILTKNSLQVSVLGAGDKGFSYKMEKQ